MLALVALLTCAAPQDLAPRPGTLAEARQGFSTSLVREDREDVPLEAPPEELFALVSYGAPSGPTRAYLSRFEPGEELRPAIVWLTGGFPTARGGSYVWEATDPDNAQAAAAFRHAGVPMLFPTVRGTADNPGFQELMMGEVDDVIAAARFLADQPGIDPERIYLGGHSTGATLALLVAESTDMFEAVFAFGPEARFEDYGREDPWPFAKDDPREWRLRSPIHLLDGIRTPTLVIEGEHGNDRALGELDAATESPWITFAIVSHADHFQPLDPVNRALARRIRSHRRGIFQFGAREVIGAYASAVARRREARDSGLLSSYMNGRIPLGTPCQAVFTLASPGRERLAQCARALGAQGFTAGPIAAADGAGFVLELRRALDFELPRVMELSAAVADVAADERVEDRGWRLLELF